MGRPQPVTWPHPQGATCTGLLLSTVQQPGLVGGQISLSPPSPSAPPAATMYRVLLQPSPNNHHQPQALKLQNPEYSGLLVHDRQEIVSPHEVL